MKQLFDFVGSPAVACLLLSVLMIEAAVLLILWRFSGKGLPPLQTLSFLGAGAAFSLALLAVLSRASEVLLAGALTAALVFHLFDIWLRWRK